MSRSESSAASSRIFAQISLAFSSRTSEPSQMMRSVRSWSKMLETNAGWAIVALRFSYRLLSNLSERACAHDGVRRGQSARCSLRRRAPTKRARDHSRALRRQCLVVVVSVVLVGRLATVAVRTGCVVVRLGLVGLRQEVGCIRRVDALFVARDRGELGDIHLVALGVDNVGLVEDDGQRLRTG